MASPLTLEEILRFAKQAAERQRSFVTLWPNKLQQIKGELTALANELQAAGGLARVIDGSFGDGLGTVEIMFTQLPDSVALGSHASVLFGPDFEAAKVLVAEQVASIMKQHPHQLEEFGAQSAREIALDVLRRAVEFHYSFAFSRD